MIVSTTQTELNCVMYAILPIPETRIVWKKLVLNNIFFPHISLQSKLNTNNLVTVITSLFFLIPNVSQYN